LKSTVKLRLSVAPFVRGTRDEVGGTDKLCLSVVGEANSGFKTREGGVIM